MINIRRSKERGYAEHGWLKSYHTFSFAGYYDPRFMGFADLRVINEDTVAANSGFGKHEHDNMEIFTWVISGELTHEDSAGNKGVLKANEAQTMSAGTGVAHSEWNYSPDKPVHLLQIWIEPRENGLPFSYDQRSFSPTEREGTQQLLVTPTGENGSLKLNQNVTISIITLQKDQELILPTGQSAVWLQSISATFSLNEESVFPGDGIAVTQETALRLSAISPGELLIFKFD